MGTLLGADVGTGHGNRQKLDEDTSDVGLSRKNDYDENRHLREELLRTTHTTRKPVVDYPGCYIFRAAGNFYVDLSDFWRNA